MTMTEPFYKVDPTEKKRDAMLLGYVRVSTVEQAKSDRTSLKEQERTVRGYAMMKGIAEFDTAIFRDPGVSGATPLDQRPGGIELLKVAKPGDTVIASKLDRMFRSAIDALQVAQLLKKKGVNLVLLDMGDQPVTSNGMAECFFAMAAAFAQLERVRIAERMADGRRAKFDKGGHIGGPPPYGFKTIGKGRDAMLEPHYEEQDVMQKILKWSGHMSVSKIIRRLDKEGIKPRAPRPHNPLPHRLRTASGHVQMAGRWQAIQIMRIRKHARRLWPEILGDHGFASGKQKRRELPVEITRSECGHHTTLWLKGVLTEGEHAAGG